MSDSPRAAASHPPQPRFSAQREARLPVFAACLLLAALVAFPARTAVAQETGSGGVLHPWQAAYDVQRYVLDLTVDPADSTLAGFAETHARIVHPTDTWRLALDPRFEISGIEELMHTPMAMQAGEGGGGQGAGGHGQMGDHAGRMHRTDAMGRRVLEPREWTRPAPDSKYLDIRFPRTLEAGERVAIRIHYAGRPRVAPNPPWGGGFVWSRTPSGAAWVGVACQTDGAWIWWPNKDHPSDEPDRGAMLTFSMPSDLTVASNGVLAGSEPVEGPGGRAFTRWSWRVVNPINTYSVTLNAAPYVFMEESYVSTAGDTMPIQFWVLPEFEEQGRRLFPQFASQIHFFEQRLGPYPFRNEKYGVAHAPYLGMEHQTLIAYGADFSDGNLFDLPIGYDDLHQHELAHEWWGNLVTAWDWRDFWIHEGFGTYMQALYAEHLMGAEGYQMVMARLRERIVGTQEIVPEGFQTTKGVYGTGRGGDIYYKGAWILHTLRGAVGEEAFDRILREFAYPTEQARMRTDGGQTRFASSTDFITLAEQVSGRDLGAFFELYLHHAALPRLEMEREATSLRLWWSGLPEGVDFRLPVEIRAGSERLRVEVGPEPVEVRIPRRGQVEADPDHWILTAPRDDSPRP